MNLNESLQLNLKSSNIHHSMSRNLCESERRALASSIASLRQMLRSRYEDRHVVAAMARLDLDSKPYAEVSRSFTDNFRKCWRYIEDVLIPAEAGKPAPQAPQPAMTFKDKVVSSALPVKEELKTMGFCDEEIDAAIAKGHKDTQSCVEYLLSLAVDAPSSPVASPAAAASGITVASNGRELVSTQAPDIQSLPHATFSQEYNGWLYKSAHDRPVQQRVVAQDGHFPVDVSPGWDLCDFDFDKDVAHICKIFPWGSQALVLADGSMCWTTGAPSTLGTPGKSFLYVFVDSKIRNTRLYQEIKLIAIRFEKHTAK